MAAGFLSGKYQQGEKAAKDTRGGGNPMNDHIFGDLAAKEQNWATLDVVRDIATSNGLTPSQVAYSWVTNRPGVTAPIIGAMALEQLEQYLIAGDLVLAGKDTVRLDEVSAPAPNDHPTPVRSEAARPLRRLQRPGDHRALLEHAVTVRTEPPSWKDAGHG